MQHGFLEVDCDDFHPMQNRKQLKKSRPLQAILARHHGKPRTLACSCGLEHGIVLWLHVRIIPRGGASSTDYHHRDHRYTLVREDVDEHFSGCIFERPDDECDTVKGRTARLFRSPVAAIATAHSGENNHPAWSPKFKHSYDTFSGYSRRLLSFGSLNAFCETNDIAEQYCMPSASEVFVGIDRAVRLLKFTDGKDGYGTAERIGCKFRFGLMFDSLAEVTSEPSHLNVWWWSDGTMRLGLVPVAADALAIAVNDLKIFCNFYRPPYAFTAVQQPDGLVTKIFFHQVHSDGRDLIFVDSGREASYAALLLELGKVFLKAVRIDDCCETLRLLGFMSPDDPTWLYRPDFIVLEQRPNRILRIRELRGFIRGAIPPYDTHLDTKGRYFQALAEQRGWDYREYPGFDLKPVPEAPLPSAWPGVRCQADAPILKASVPYSASPPRRP